MRLIGALSAVEQHCKRGYPSVTVPDGVVGENGVENGERHTLVDKAETEIEDAKSAAEAALGFAQEAVYHIEAAVERSQEFVWVTDDHALIAAFEKLLRVAEHMRPVSDNINVLKSVAQDAHQKDGPWSIWSRKVSLAQKRCRDEHHAVDKTIRACFQAWNRVRGRGFETTDALFCENDQVESNKETECIGTAEARRSFRVAK